MGDQILVGFFAGFIIAGLLGLILGNIRRENFNANAPNRPMTVATQRTPRQVIEDAERARFRLYGWRFLFLCIVIVGSVAALWFFGF